MRLFSRGRDTSSADEHESPRAEAARWLAREELGLLKGDEAAAFERWRAQAENQQEQSELQATLDRVQTAVTSPGIMRMREEALAARPRGPLLLGNVPARVAACVLLGIVVTLLFVRESDRSAAVSQAQRAPTPTLPASEVYETRKGEVRSFKLADGSMLTLNTASRVEVGLTAKRRDLRLLSGEALFAVAHDTERPFVVAAGPVKVTALGTQFGVRLQPEGAKVVLLEGHVRVEPLTLKGLARVLPILAREELTPGQQLIAEAQNEMAIAVADTERSTSWRQGRLVFRGDALEDAVAEFNRYSEHQIFIADPTLARLPVSGVFATAHPENFIAAVSGFYDLRVEQRGANVTELGLRAK